MASRILGCMSTFFAGDRERERERDRERERERERGGESEPERERERERVFSLSSRVPTSLQPQPFKA